MVKVARGKALVAKLRAQPGVRDPEALAAELGRKKALRHAAKKAKGKATKFKKHEGRSKGSEDSQQQQQKDATRARIEDRKLAKKQAEALAAIPADTDIKRQVEAQAKRLNMPNAVKERILKKRLKEAAKARAAIKNIR